MENKDHKDLLENLVPLDHKDLLDLEEKLVNVDLLDSQVNQAPGMTNIHLSV